MKQEYPDFKRERISSDNIYETLPDYEKKIVHEFLRFCSITAGAKKVDDIRGILLQIRHVIEIPLDAIAKSDVRSFLALLNASSKRDWTKHGIKVTLKRFLKWNYPDWSSRFDQLADIKLRKVSTQDRYTEDKLLTAEDLEKMLRAADTLREKALLILLFESGARPQEIVTLRWKNIKYEGNHGVVNVFSEKTREARSVPIKDSVLHLKRWYQEFAFPGVGESDYVFPSAKVRSKAMNVSTMWYLLRRVADRAGIQKNVYAYLFRHARARELYEELPEQLAKKLLGHAKDSRMPAIYSHTRDSKAITAMLQKVYHIEEITSTQQHKLEREVEYLQKELIHIRKENRKILKMAKKVQHLLDLE